MFSTEIVELRKKIATEIDNPEYKDLLSELFAFLVKAVGELDQRLEKIENNLK